MLSISVGVSLRSLSTTLPPTLIVSPKEGIISRSDGVGIEFEGDSSFVAHSFDQIAVSLQ